MLFDPQTLKPGYRRPGRQYAANPFKCKPASLKIWELKNKSRHFTLWQQIWKFVQRHCDQSSWMRPREAFSTSRPAKLLLHWTKFVLRTLSPNMASNY